MNRELLAILPRMPGEKDDPPGLPDGTRAHHSGDWTVILSTGRAPSAFGRALRRQRIKDAPRRMRQLEALMPFGPVLPAVPGYVVPERDIDGLLLANDALIAQLSARTLDKVQFQVTVDWNAADVLDKFRDTPEIAPLFTAPVVTTDAMTRGIARLTTRLCTNIVSQLEPCAEEIAELPMSDTMVCNVVLLIERAQVPALDRAIEAVDAIWPEGFRIRQIGPAPATSFCAFKVQRHGPKSLARARRVLNLPAHCTERDVAEARQTRLRRGDQPVEDIRRAAQLLTVRARLGPEANHVYLMDVQSETARPRAQQAAIA